MYTKKIRKMQIVQILYSCLLEKSDLVAFLKRVMEKFYSKNYCNLEKSMVNYENTGKTGKKGVKAADEKLERAISAFWYWDFAGDFDDNIRVCYG